MKRLLLLTSALVAVSTGARAQIVFQGQSTFDSNYPAAFSGSRGNPAGFTVGGGAADANASLSLSARGTGQVIVPSPLNVTSSQGYLIGGLQAIDLSVGALGQWGVYVGPGAGSYQLYNGVAVGFGSVGIGTYALNALQNSGGEDTCGGAFACQYATTVYGVTAWGEHTIGYDNANYATAIGNDVMRDVVGAFGSTAVGAQSQDDGVGNTNTALGSFSLMGNAGSILVAGTVTTGDRNCIPFTSSNAAVSQMPATACYTSQAGDTTTSVATGLASAIANIGAWTPGGGPSPGNGVQVGADEHGLPGGTQIVRLHFPGGNTTGWAIQPGTPTCSGGACTEVLTVQAPFSGTNIIAVGSSAVGASGMVGGQGLIGVGDFALANLIGSGSNYTICEGYFCGSALYSTSNSILMGANVLTSNGTHSGYTSTNDVMLLTNGMNPSTYTGNKNVILGAGALSGGAVGNVSIGWNAVMASQSGNWQLSIQDAITGSGNNAGGGGSGGGQIGIESGSAALNATLLVGDYNGAAYYGSHIGVQQTTKPTITNGSADATASDTAGTVTLTAANPVVTFKVAYQTAPHCVISSPSGTAFTYSVSTTALTLTGGANTNTVTYHCIQ